MKPKNSNPLLFHLQKQQNRVDSLGAIGWPQGKKEKCMPVLNNIDYMSSEESEIEEEEGQRRLVFYVKKLTWERSELRNGKQELDELYMSTLSCLALLKWVKRVRKVRESDRPHPDCRFRWAVAKECAETSPAKSAQTTCSSSYNSGSVQPLHISTPTGAVRVPKTLGSSWQCKIF